MKIVKAQEFKNKPKNVTIITYMAKMKQIKIKDEFVTLGQFLKLADLISSGGEAKFFLRENTVVINNEEDDRRGRKLYENDIVKINGEVFEICR